MTRNVHPERVPGSPRTDSPAMPIVWVAPEQVTHRALVWHFLDPVQGPDVVQRVQRRTQAPVQAEYLVFDQSRQRQVVKLASERGGEA